MRVGDIMHNLVTASSSATVLEVAKLMKKKAIGSVVIKNGDNLLGILTERDIMTKIVAEYKDPTKVNVRSVMASPILTIDADSEISEASKKMEKHNIRRLLVKENDKIVGIITLRDVTKSMRYTLVRNKQYKYARPDYYGHKIKE